MDRSLVANAAAYALNVVAGGGTAVVSKSKDGVYTVSPSSEQLPALRAQFEAAMAGKPSVTVDVLPVVWPYVLRKAAPLALTALSLSFLVGYSIRRRKDIGRA